MVVRTSELAMEFRINALISFNRRHVASDSVSQQFARKKINKTLFQSVHETINSYMPYCTAAQSTCTVQRPSK